MMEVKKNIALLSLVFILFLGGCGKKEEKTKKVSLGEGIETSQALASAETTEIPVLKEEIEDFFDDNDAVSEFAFVDENEEGKKDGEDLKGLFESKKESFVSEADSEKEENVFVSWDDDKESKDVVFRNVQFDLNKNDIKDDQKFILKENIEIAKAAVKKGKKVAIQGHCCQLGSPSFNIPLSERRAKVIKEEMVKSGIPEDKIRTLGCGQEFPIVWSDKSDRKEMVNELSLNRRAEIEIS